MKNNGRPFSAWIGLKNRKSCRVLCIKALQDFSIVSREEKQDELGTAVRLNEIFPLHLYRVSATLRRCVAESHAYVLAAMYGTIW